MVDSDPANGLHLANLAPMAAAEDDDFEAHEMKACLEQEPETEPDTGPRPPDGGYGWVIVFAGFMVNMIGGCVDAYGVFYIRLLEYFGESNATTAWPGSVCYAIILGAGMDTHSVKNL